MQRTNNKYMKNYDKNKESSYLKYWDVNIIHDWTMLQMLSLNHFKQVQDLSEFDGGFMKNYND